MQPETQLGDVDDRMIRENVIQRINKIKTPGKPTIKPSENDSASMPDASAQQNFHDDSN